MTRIDPVAPPYEPALAQELAKWMGGIDVEPLVLFRTLMRNPDLASRMRVLGSGLLAKGSLPASERELVIHRVCALTDCRYEWTVHATLFGSAVGLTPEQLNATVTGDHAWSPRQSALLAAVDELHETASLSDPTWTALADHLDTNQLLEFLVLSGWYRMISYLANTLRLAAEPWATSYPSGKDTGEENRLIS
jgi:alkylhydroperoxidase family enzyme